MPFLQLETPPTGFLPYNGKGSDLLKERPPEGLKGYHKDPPPQEAPPRDEDGESNWLRIAKSAYESSTSYVDTNYRKTWDDSLRAFNNQHASDSKYSQPAFTNRSKLFRPKVRSVIRKNEAAAAAAFFSSQDVTNVIATDQTSKVEVASASIHKALLQYRLTKTIPWFLTLLGGLQDAQNVGVACAHIYWDYKEGPEGGESWQTLQAQPVGPAMQPMQPGAQQQPKKPKPISDKPCIDLIPVENLRLSPSCNWTDPINSSPFLIHLIPMYLMDVKDKMRGGEWYRYGDGALKVATQMKYDSTRSARLTQRENPFDPASKGFSGYEICWVQRHIHRKGDEDWEFYTLGDFAMLTPPRPLKEVVLHGRRPYVMGCVIIETHKLYPSSVPTLGKDLQDEANEVANQRIDNVKFVLNKKWFVKRGAEVEIAGLVRNVPGGVVQMGNPDTDVREITWPDVTASAYEEQSRIDNDLNDLLGNFSAAQVMADHGVNGPARNMAILGQGAATLVEYLLRTFVETFVQPVLRQLMMLEQCYETDQTVLAVAAKQANLLQKFGIDQVTDELLEQELTLNVNVGMGATDPQLRLQKFMLAMHSYVEMLKEVPPGINMEEVGKEIMANLGYQDGSRFLTQDNPQLLQMQQKLQESQKLIQELQMKLTNKQMAHEVKLKTNTENNQVRLATVKIKEDGENKRSAVTHLHALMQERAAQAEAHRNRAHDVNMSTLDKMHERVLHRMSAENHAKEHRQIKGGE